MCVYVSRRDYKDHAACVPLRWRPECWGWPPSHLPWLSLSTRRLCPTPCLTIIYSAVEDRAKVTTHTSLTWKHWLPMSVHPCLTCIGPHHLYTLKILRITGPQDGMIKWLSVKCCCWVNKHIIILLVSLLAPLEEIRSQTFQIWSAMAQVCHVCHKSIHSHTRCFG